MRMAALMLGLTMASLCSMSAEGNESEGAGGEPNPNEFKSDDQTALSDSTTDAAGNDLDDVDGSTDPEAGDDDSIDPEGDVEGDESDTDEA
jgi:hypothetical protein